MFVQVKDLQNNLLNIFFHYSIEKHFGLAAHLHGIIFDNLPFNQKNALPILASGLTEIRSFAHDWKYSTFSLSILTQSSAHLYYAQIMNSIEKKTFGVFFCQIYVWLLKKKCSSVELEKGWMKAKSSKRGYGLLF